MLVEPLIEGVHRSQDLAQGKVAIGRIIPIQIQRGLETGSAHELRSYFVRKFRQLPPCWRAITLKAFVRAWPKRL